MISGGVLYRDDASTVFLLDIPRSIEDAQGSDDTLRRRLLSVAPVEQPFNTPEPKSERARQRCGNMLTGLHAEYAAAVQLALADIHAHHVGKWCEERHLSLVLRAPKRTADSAGLDEHPKKEPGTETDARKQPEDKMLTPGIAHNLPDRAPAYHLTHDGTSRELPDAFLKAASASQGFEELASSAITVRLSVTASSTAAEAQKDIGSMENVALPAGLFLQNPINDMLQAEVSILDDCRSFYLPPLSRAVLAPCDDSATLRSAIRGTIGADTAPDARKFDLILLDPPWPNRSAKRRGSYDIQYSLHDMKRLLYGLVLDIQLASAGYVAVWITNRAAVRDLVLGSDGRTGWFESLGVELIEEWIWIKTTVSGEPISALNSVWRKPYEVLLVGRRSTGFGGASAACQLGVTKRRVIAAVPDLHSRKPCMKALFADVLFAGRQYQALEVFARHLVAGWWSWGNEAIKYNWTGSWS